MNTQRLQHIKEELERRWDMLGKVLLKLQHEKILETRAEEKLRLECKIDEINAERQGIEQELDDLESKLLRKPEEQQEIQKYLSILENDLNVWQGRLGLGRSIQLEEIYVWVNLENEGENRGSLLSDSELCDYLMAKGKRHKKQNALIVGGPGTGKTTLIRQWGYAAAKNLLEKQGKLLPLFVSLYQLGQDYGKANCSWTIEDIVFRQTYGEYATLHPDLKPMLREAVNNSNAVIFLDAADEVPEKARDFIVDWLNRLSSHTSSCPIILTSRPILYIDRFVTFEKYRILEFPVVGVSWYEAVAFCQWLTIRLRGGGLLAEKEAIQLPTEAQWEKAARGTDERIYPWGNEFDSEHLNYIETGLGVTSTVGCFPHGVSPYGCEEMAGNVFEWCWDWYGEYSKENVTDPIGPDPGLHRIYRGGCWNFPSAGCRSACRGGWSCEPTQRGTVWGFRLLKTPLYSYTI